MPYKDFLKWNHKNLQSSKKRKEKGNTELAEQITNIQEDTELV